MVDTEIRLIIFFAAKDGEAVYSQQKQDQELTVARIMKTLLSNSYLPANAGDEGLIPGSGRSPRVRNSNLFQYCCLENSMNRGAWQATAHGIRKSQT